MKCPRRFYNKWDDRGTVPKWAAFFWPWTHYCPDMDEMLIVDNLTDCFCGHVPDAERQRDSDRRTYSGPVEF